MFVMFATLCDKCKKRSEEYTAWHSCEDCQEDTCPDCDVESERQDDENLTTLCKTCAKLRKQDAQSNY